MIQIRWYAPSDGSDVKKLQYRYMYSGVWSIWFEVPHEYYVKDTTASVSTLPLAKE